jgi:hypothetical protein
MEGSGVTNYAVGKPSFAYSAATTEFDDALIRRRVITREDAIVAKGATRDQARQLLREAEQASAQARRERDEIDLVKPQLRSGEVGQDDGEGVEDDDDDDDDDEFLEDEMLQRYRERRLEELRMKQKDDRDDGRPEYGEVLLISRPEWTRHVNDASRRGWVVVCLTSSDAERTGLVESACRSLAAAHPATKFVLIPSRSAIPNWPDHNLPSLFLYRHGAMQHQLVRLPPDLTAPQLERMLSDLSAL